jgi:hypothetical protein
MTHKWMMPLYLVLALVLAGCGSSGKTRSGAAETVLNEDYADAMSIRSQLVLGTLRLQETDLAATNAQAAELLPLWQAARSLTKSGTGATEETDAVLEQIQAAMTPEQLEAIAEMALTRADNQAMAQSIGLSTGSGEGTGGGQGQNLSAEERATRQAEREASGAVGVSEALLDQLIETLEATSK